MAYNNYVIECINEHQVVDEMFREYIMESLQIESDFILSCLENNIILEADESSDKKLSWWRRLGNTIKTIFGKFTTKVNELTGRDEAFIKNQLPKLNQIDSKEFTNLEVNLKITNFKPNDAEVKRLMNLIKQSQTLTYALKNAEEIKKNFGEDNEALKKKIRHSILGWGDEEPKEEKFTRTPLQGICRNMAQYVKTYKNETQQIQKNINDYNRVLEVVGRSIDRKEAATESTFSVLENAFYRDTDLRYCYNYKSVMEADEGDNPPAEGEKKKEEPKLNTVVDKTQENDDKSVTGNLNLEQLKAVKEILQKGQLALTTQMSTYEEMYMVAMKVLKGVISAKAPKGKPVKNTEENK